MTQRKTEVGFLERYRKRRELTYRGACGNGAPRRHAASAGTLVLLHPKVAEIGRGGGVKEFVECCLASGVEKAGR